MEFREGRSIYLQIADYVCEQILLEHWPVGSKIISIRELAVLVEVNPNTVQRAYDILQQRDIIVNKRGVGYFIDEKAIESVIAFRKEQFLEDELDIFFRNMYLLKIPVDEINKRYEQFIKKNFNRNNDEA